MKATREGWEYYLEHDEYVNPFIQTYNSEVPLDALRITRHSRRKISFLFLE